MLRSRPQAKESSNKRKKNQKSRMVSQNAKEEYQSINHQSIFNTVLNQAILQKGRKVQYWVIIANVLWQESGNFLILKKKTVSNMKTYKIIKLTGKDTYIV